MAAAQKLDEMQQREGRRISLEQAQVAAAADARAAGASWAQIGDALGITKQAAQKRHDRRLF